MDQPSMLQHVCGTDRFIICTLILMRAQSFDASAMLMQESCLVDANARVLMLCVCVCCVVLCLCVFVCVVLCFDAVSYSFLGAMFYLFA